VEEERTMIAPVAPPDVRPPHPAGLGVAQSHVHFENCTARRLAPAGLNDGSARPSVDLWFELETECNIQCRFCYNYWKDGQAPKPTRHGTAATLAGLRRLLAAVECRQFALSGGEPLLRADLGEIVDTVAAYDVPLVLTTNGVLLTPERVNALSRAGVRTFQIAVHSHRQDRHDALTGVPSWGRAIRALAAVRDSVSDAVVVFVATRANARDFPAMISLCSDLGVERIIFNRFIPTGSGAVHRQALGGLDERALVDILTDADARASSDGVRIQLGVPISVPEGVRERWRSVDLASCPVRDGQRRWTLGSDLRLRRCNHSPASIGSVLEDGLDRLLAEIGRAADDESDGPVEVQPCRLLEPRPLIQVRVPGREPSSMP
jgi:MoaA/NifB/PqqE/SkfB family radical SAM enzyme